jgi:hypothetical protein
MGGGDIMSTVLAMRAVQLYVLEGRRDEMRGRLERAGKWLSATQPVLHQDLVYKLLGLAWTGTPPHELQADLTRLRDLQRGDGGWAQLPHLESDAWATGQSLVALYTAGRVPTTDAAFRRGIDYLLATQFDDGSWYVKSRSWPFQPPFESGFPHGHDQWISDGATAWAVMALVLGIEPASPSTVPSKQDPPRPALAARGDAAPNTPAPSVPAAAKPRSGPVDFAREIKPVIERSCRGCHSGETPQGGYIVLSRERLLRGGESGEAAVSPGQSDQSPLFARVSSNDPDLAMPPLDKRDKFAPLSHDEVAAFRAWIDEGANWPDDVTIQAKGH